MTIAIGFSGNNGIVLAADSQITVSGYIKGRQGKIHTVVYPNGTVVAFAGSGTTDYIRTAIDKAIDGLGECDNLPDVARILEKNLLAFFDAHLGRWAYFPADERPTVELLIGATTRLGAFGLFYYGGTSFYRVGRKAIGAGLLLANNMVAQYESAIVSATIPAMSILAVQILSKVKAQVDTCGGFTDLIALGKNGDFALTDSRKIEKLEKKIEAIEKKSAEALTKKLLTIPVQLSWLRESAEKIRASFTGGQPGQNLKASAGTGA